MMSPSDVLLNELRTTLGKMEVALGAISEAIVWTDESGTVQWCNTAFDRLVGRPHIQVLGASCREMMPLQQDGRPIDPDSHPLHRALSGDPTGPESYEFRAAGQRVILEISATRVQFGAENLSVVMLHRDVTTRRHMEQDLKQKMQELETMNRFMLDRESRVLDLKQEVNDLLKQLNRLAKYGS